jgi:competence protein ComEA
MSASPTPTGWGRPRRLLIGSIVAALAIALRALPGLGEAPADAPPPASIAVPANDAPARVLLALPNLGPTRVERIVEARRDRPFDSIDDLAQRVKGVGPTTAEGLVPCLRFDPDDPPR